MSCRIPGEAAPHTVTPRPWASPQVKGSLVGGHVALSVVGGKQPHKESPLEQGEGSRKDRQWAFGALACRRRGPGQQVAGEACRVGPWRSGYFPGMPSRGSCREGLGQAGLCWGVASHDSWACLLGPSNLALPGRSWVPRTGLGMGSIQDQGALPIPRSPPQSMGAFGLFITVAVHTGQGSPRGGGAMEELRGGLGAGGGARGRS